jgi:hypothetical protein
MFDDVAFLAYVAHAESIEDFINALAQEEDPNDPYTQRRLAYECNLDINILTASEIEYIQKEVSERR